MSRVHDPVLEGGAREPLLLAGSVGEAPAQVNVVQLVHRVLRGRYLLAITLGGIGAVAGAAAGWYSQKPEYICQGQIRIQSTLPKILYDSEQTAMLPYFAGFVNTQASLLQGTRVITQAMMSDAWRALGRGSNPNEEREFRKRLRVTNPRDAVELILVTFNDESREAATTAVREVIQAYVDFYGKEGSIGDDVTISTLNDLRKARTNEAAALEEQIRDQAKEYGSTDLTELLQFYRAQQLALLSKRDDAKARLTDRGLRPGDRPKVSAPDSPPPPRVLTPEVAAGSDPTMRDLLNRRLGANEQVDRLKARGLGEGHNDVINARAHLKAIEMAIDRRLKELEDGGWTAGPTGTGSGPLFETDDQLLARYDMLEQQVAEIQKQVAEVGNRQIELRRLNAKLTEVRTSLAAVNTRLDQITVERNVPQKIGGRISVLSYGDTPSFPEVDGRKKFAAMGFVFGGGLPVGLVMAWGLVRRRFRYSDEARELGPNLALLGVLPHLPKTMDDPEEAAAATHCVHQIRTMLQLGGGGSDQVYCLTSAEAAEGKTSLTLALGLSYAKSGARTLLIDADMIGRGLSSDLGVRTEVGLAAALREGNLNGAVVPTPYERLSLVPVGLHDERSLPEFTTAAARRLIERARRDYDVILVDTGPILGSLEAACMSAQSDGVIVVVGRGQHRSRLERALERLRSIHARVVGLVFNRASSTDFHQSTSAASIRSVVATASTVVEADAEQRARAREVGPLAGAMLITSRSST
jgi:succinoglycan biosynthesis transport protein ExoP